MMKKKIIVTSLIGLMSISLGVSLSSKNSLHAFASETTHVGNHYTMLAPTTTKAGVREYWVCCDCHEHFLTLPPKGNWTDLAGVERASIESSDDRYISQFCYVRRSENVSFLHNRYYYDSDFQEISFLNTEDNYDNLLPHVHRQSQSHNQE